MSIYSPSNIIYFMQKWRCLTYTFDTIVDYVGEDVEEDAVVDVEEDAVVGVEEEEEE